MLTKEKIRDFFVPNHNEGMMYLTTVGIVSLLILDPFFKMLLEYTLKVDQGFSGALTQLKENWQYIIVLLFALFGGSLSLWHAFVEREKSFTEMTIMQLYMVVAELVIGVACLYYIYQTQDYLFIVFPVWNLIRAIYLAFVEDADGDFHQRDMNLIENIIGVFVVVGFNYLAINHMIMHWSVVLSIDLTIVLLISWIFFLRKMDYAKNES